MLLKNFPDCVARTLFEAEERVDANARGSVFELRGEERRFLFEVNVARLGEVTLISAGCDVPCRLTWVPAAFVRQVFQISGRSELSFEKRLVRSEPNEVSCLVPAGTVLQVQSDAKYESFSVRIGPDALKKKLVALLGEDAALPEFDHSAPLHHPGMRSLRLAALELAREMDQIGAQLAAPVLAELAQSVILKFLLYHKHNYSDRLMRPAASPSERQLKLIEDYIAAHWNESLDIERLAEVSGIGARTIFRLFAKERGSSPSMLIRKIRLDQAKTMLLCGCRETSVLAIAMECGFHSFGHFAREYRQTFGELPFETLRRSSPRNPGARGSRIRPPR